VLVLDVACIRGMGSPWTTFFFIVTWLIPFELPFSVGLSCCGLCLDVLLICMPASGSLAIRGVL
jgi:hypothetical protein